MRREHGRTRERRRERATSLITSPNLTDERGSAGRNGGRVEQRQRAAVRVRPRSALANHASSASKTQDAREVARDPLRLDEERIGAEVAQHEHRRIVAADRTLLSACCNRIREHEGYRSPSRTSTMRERDETHQRLAARRYSLRETSRITRADTVGGAGSAVGRSSLRGDHGMAARTASFAGTISSYQSRSTAASAP